MFSILRSPVVPVTALRSAARLITPTIRRVAISPVRGFRTVVAARNAAAEQNSLRKGLGDFRAATNEAAESAKAESSDGHLRFPEPHPAGESNVHQLRGMLSDYAALFNRRMEQLDKKSSFSGFSLFRWGLGGLVLIGGVGYVFRNPIKAYLATESKDIAVDITSSTELQKQINETAKQLVQLLSRDDFTKANLVQLLHGVLLDPHTTKITKEFMMPIIVDLTQQEWAIKAVEEMFAQVFVGLQTNEVAKHAATEFVVQVLSEASLQQATGDAMWGAIYHAVTPKLLRRKENAAAAAAKTPAAADAAKTAHDAALIKEGQAHGIEMAKQQQVTTHSPPAMSAPVAAPVIAPVPVATPIPAAPPVTTAAPTPITVTEVKQAPIVVGATPEAATTAPPAAPARDTSGDVHVTIPLGKTETQNAPAERGTGRDIFRVEFGLNR